MKHFYGFDNRAHAVCVLGEPFVVKVETHTPQTKKIVVCNPHDYYVSWYPPEGDRMRFKYHEKGYQAYIVEDDKLVLNPVEEKFTVDFGREIITLVYQTDFGTFEWRA